MEFIGCNEIFRDAFPGQGISLKLFLLSADVSSKRDGGADLVVRDRGETIVSHAVYR